MVYSQQEIEDLKNNIDLEAHLKLQGFEFKKHGRHVATLCPFHEDKNPSLIVTPNNNLWNCPVCGAGGSIIDFEMKYRSLSFLDAVKHLKERHSIPLETREQTTAPKVKRTIPRAKLLERVCAFYQKTFHEDSRGRKYLESRGINKPSIFENFRIGFCNGTLYKSLPSQGEILEDLKELGILQENGMESFQNCIIVPILNTSGAVVSFYGRKVDSSAVSHLYLKGDRAGLVNGNILKTYDEVILSESIIDGLSLYQAGIKNTLPCFGTNGFTQHHLKHVKRSSAKRFIISFNSDTAGRKGALKLRQELQTHQLKSHLFEVPQANDHNEYLLKEGEEKLRNLFIETAKKKKEETLSPIVQLDDGLLLQFGVRKYMVRGIESTANRLRANIKAVNCTKFHIDTFDLYSAKARKSFIRDASLMFQEEPEIIENDILSLIGSLESSSKNKGKEKANPSFMSDKARSDALRFGRSKSLIETILKDLDLLGYLGESNNKMASYLAMTSRKMNDPLSVMILSASGAGKSALQDTVLSLCPNEELLKLTSLSERALFYKESNSLKNKVLALAEEAGAEDASYAIRNLISNKELVIESTVKDQLSGRMTTMKNVVKGPTAVFKTTTNPETDPETRSRFLILAVDESLEQTQRILAYQREMQTLEGFIRSQKKDKIIEKHKNFQRLLRNVAVFNPYARLLSYQEGKLWVRRDQPKYLRLINSIAFLHQLQRPLKRKGTIEYIEVTLEDIALANQISIDIMGRSIDDLSSPGRKLLELIQNLVAKKQKEKEIETPQITRKEIRETSGWGETYVRTILRELIRLDYLVVVRGRFGQSYKYELSQDFINEKPKQVLTNVEALREKAKALGVIV